MTDFEDIKITDYDVKLGEVRHQCYLHFALNREPEDGWVKEFVSEFRISIYRGIIDIKIEGTDIVVDTHRENVGARLRKTIEESMAKANRWFKYNLDTEAAHRAEKEAYQQLTPEEKREREAELKRKLLEDDE